MEKYLIDTQILLWHSQNPQLLTKKVNAVIYSEAQLYVSMASFWEIAIKIKTGKLQLSFNSLSDFFDIVILKSHFIVLNITKDDIVKTNELDLIHRDPFDRIIIATALQNKMLVISSDEIFDKYPIQRIW